MPPHTVFPAQFNHHRLEDLAHDKIVKRLSSTGNTQLTTTEPHYAKDDQVHALC